MPRKSAPSRRFYLYLAGVLTLLGVGFYLYMSSQSSERSDGSSERPERPSLAGTTSSASASAARSRSRSRSKTCAGKSEEEEERGDAKEEGDTKSESDAEHSLQAGEEGRPHPEPIRSRAASAEADEGREEEKRVSAPGSGRVKRRMHRTISLDDVTEHKKEPSYSTQEDSATAVTETDATDDTEGTADAEASKAEEEPPNLGRSRSPASPDAPDPDIDLFSEEKEQEVDPWVQLRPQRMEKYAKMAARIAKWPRWRYRDGVLKVHCQRGIDIDKKDRNSESDPYVKIKVNKTVRKTKYISDDKDPSWDQILEFPVQDVTRDTAFIEVYDHNTWEKDTFIGSFIVKIADICRRHGHFHGIFPLPQSERNAKIVLDFKYSED